MCLLIILFAISIVTELQIASVYATVSLLIALTHRTQDRTYIVLNAKEKTILKQSKNTTKNSNNTTRTFQNTSKKKF